MRTSRRGARGASAVEYALLAALVAAVIVGVALALGNDARSLYESVDF